MGANVSSGHLVIAVLALAVVAAGPGPAAGATGSARGGAALANHDAAAGTNVTVVPQGRSHRQPGRTDASYYVYAVQSGDFARLDRVVVTYADGGWEECSVTSVGSYAIDRGNDDPGTKTDHAMASDFENAEFGENDIVVDYYDEGDLGGDSTFLNSTDQVIATFGECIRNPAEPGWYRISGTIEGVGYDGRAVSSTMESHYFYICDCADRQAAEQQLGPPPGSGGDDTGSGGGGGTATTTATPTATATPDRTAEAEPTETVTATAPPRTATATATVDPTATATATATADPTATATATAPPRTVAATATPTVTAGEQSAGRGGGQRAASGGARMTPTYGAGPGFGALAALAGLLVGLLGRRR